LLSTFAISASVRSFGIPVLLEAVAAKNYVQPLVPDLGPHRLHEMAPVVHVRDVPRVADATDGLWDLTARTLSAAVAWIDDM
jgi:hypothetical protein